MNILKYIILTKSIAGGPTPPLSHLLQADSYLSRKVHDRIDTFVREDEVQQVRALDFAFYELQYSTLHKLQAERTVLILCLEAKRPRK